MRVVTQFALLHQQVGLFGIGLNRPLDAVTAEKISTIFTEVIVAPDAADDAKALLARKKNLRLLTTGGLPDPHAAGEVFRSVAGGFLVQSRDRSLIKPSDLKIVTRRQPTPTEIQDMLFAFTVAKHVKSNAIVYAKDGQTAGIGAGQMSRIDSARIASIKAVLYPADVDYLYFVAKGDGSHHFSKTFGEHQTAARRYQGN